MLYPLYVIGVFLARIIPLKVCYFVASLISWVYFIFARENRKELKENFKVILGEDTDKNILNKHVLGVFRNFAKYLADFFKFPKFTKNFIEKNIAIKGLEYLDECLNEGKGVIILSLHLGNWEMGAAVIGGWGYPMNAIVLKHSSRRVNNFFVRQRAINGVKSIPVGTQIKECFRALKRNEILAIVGDKDYTSSGIFVDFFGRKALIPKGPAIFALRTGAPILFSVLTREDGDKFKFSFDKPIRYKPTGNYNNDIRLLMGEYLRVFEKYIQKNPDQWYAFKRIWNPEKITQ